MRTHIYKECGNTDCASKKDKSLGNIWGDPMHDVFVNDGRQFTRCTICSKEQHFNDQTHGRQRYPYYNGSTGTTFESKSQERDYVKKNNLDAL